MAANFTDTLSVDLDTNTVSRGGVTFKVPNAQAVLLHVLLEGYPEIVPHAVLKRALYGSSKTADLKTIRVTATHLRRILPALRVQVHTVHGVGYMLAINEVTPEVTP